MRFLKKIIQFLLCTAFTTAVLSTTGNASPLYDSVMVDRIDDHNPYVNSADNSWEVIGVILPGSLSEEDIQRVKRYLLKETAVITS